MFEFLLLALFAFLIFAAGSKPNDPGTERPARCFAPARCRWPDCTCFQHQTQRPF
jgi:hypothetical protein